MFKFIKLIFAVVCLSVVGSATAGQAEWDEVAATVCKNVYDLKIDLGKVLDYTLLPGSYGIAKRENGEVHIFADNKCYKHDPKNLTDKCLATKVNWYVEGNTMHLTHTNNYLPVDNYYCTIDE